MFWKVIDAVPVGWRVALGAKEKERAEELASKEPGDVMIRLLLTQESIMPSDAPEYNERIHAYRSERWCVLVPDTNK